MGGQAPRRNIIVCCDGTAHSAIKGNDLNPYTNVLRLSRYIKARDSTGCPQIVGYVSGIGTSVGHPVNTYLQGPGIGIGEKIKEAYNFICNNYVNDDAAEEEAEIFLIGFSRGAFVARCVADLINKIGILTKMGIHYIYDLWQHNEPDFLNLLLKIANSSQGVPAVFSSSSSSSTHLDKNEKTENEKDREEFKNDLQSILTKSKYVRRGVHVKVCAVWDTVASLGHVSAHLSIFGRWKSRKLNFVDSHLWNGIDHAIQALSLHEHRRPFCPIVWKLPDTSGEKRNGIPRLQQCWFMGYHSDIGGGIRGEGLAHFPLAWMMSKLKKFLEFDDGNFWNPRPKEGQAKIDGPESSSGTSKTDIKDSMSKRYRLAGSHYRKPRRHFWLHRPKTYPLPVKFESCEALHFTVQLLLRDPRAVEPSKMMKGAEFRHG